MFHRVGERIVPRVLQQRRCSYRLCDAVGEALSTRCQGIENASRHMACTERVAESCERGAWEYAVRQSQMRNTSKALEGGSVNHPPLDVRKTNGPMNRIADGLVERQDHFRCSARGGARIGVGLLPS